MLGRKLAGDLTEAIDAGGDSTKPTEGLDPGQRTGGRVWITEAQADRPGLEHRSRINLAVTWVTGDQGEIYLPSEVLHDLQGFRLTRYSGSAFGGDPGKG